MKKRTILTGKLIATGLLGVFLTLGSCQKDEVEVAHQEPVKNDVETYQDIQRITEDFIRVQHLQGENDDRLPNWLKKLAKNVFNDLVGAAGGAKVGSLFGPVGTWVGAGVGAAAGTIAGLESGGAVDPDDGAAVNPENAYDKAGTAHNGLLHDGYMDNYDRLFDSGELNAAEFVTFADTWLVDNGFIAPGETSGYTTAQLESDLRFVAENEGSDMTAVVRVCEVEGVMGAIESDLLYLYYDAMESALTLDAFLDYSVRVEEEITESSYDSRVKAYVLSCMAVTRQDLHFWDMNTP